MSVTDHAAEYTRAESPARNWRRMPTGQSVAQALVAAGHITLEQLRQVEAEQKRVPARSLGVIRRLRVIDEARLLAFLSERYGLPELPETELSIPPGALDIIPLDVARRHALVPVAYGDDAVMVAVTDPTDVLAIDAIALVAKRTVLPVLAPSDAIATELERAGRADREDDVQMGELLTSPASALDEEKIDVLDLRISADQPPVVKLVNRILLDAIAKRASDIHWEPSENALRVRYRVDGLLLEAAFIPKATEAAVLSRLKIIANLDIAERRRPQDGRVKLRTSETEVDLRLSIMPTILGEKAVVRILDRDMLQTDLSELGLCDSDLNHVLDAVRRPHGMMLVTGPTGSGKTTTLYSALKTINLFDRNIMTVEDPVEYNLKGVNQVQTNDAVGRTFPAVLRSLLRQDPDVILVGEMRDLETAEISVRAALTGHLVLSTLHTNDAPGAVTRLVEIGVPRFLLCSSLTLVVAQRLVRKMCPRCRYPYRVPDDALAEHGVPATGRELTLFAAKGCAACAYTGTKGRTGIYQVMPIVAEIRDAITAGVGVDDFRRIAQARGLKTLFDVGFAKAVAGSVTLEEVIRVTGGAAASE